MLRYYFEIDSKQLKNWPHKYLTIEGMIDSLGYHNLPTALAAAAYDASEYVIEYCKSDDHYSHYKYISSRGPTRHLTADHLTFIKLASIEL